MRQDGVECSRYCGPRGLDARPPLCCTLRLAVARSCCPHTTSERVKAAAVAEAAVAEVAEAAEAADTRTQRTPCLSCTSKFRRGHHLPLWQSTSTININSTSTCKVLLRSTRFHTQQRFSRIKTTSMGYKYFKNEKCFCIACIVAFLRARCASSIDRVFPYTFTATAWLRGG